jgi:hypothetical protein
MLVVSSAALAAASREPERGSNLAPMTERASSLQRHTFSSRRNSSKNRQSVLSAMIFCGFILIMPVSRARSP